MTRTRDVIAALFGTPENMLDVIADQKRVRVSLPAIVVSMTNDGAEARVLLELDSGRRIAVPIEDIEGPIR